MNEDRVDRRIARAYVDGARVTLRDLNATLGGYHPTSPGPVGRLWRRLVRRLSPDRKDRAW